MNQPNSHFLLINKPRGWTSHDVVAYIRKGIFLRQSADQNDKKQKIKVGHAGTLDPFATGLLIVGVGREYTKRLDEFKKLPKTYIATIRLGAVSDTYDSDGKIESKMTNEDNAPSLEKIEEVIKNFIGRQLQTPPMYSAKKINGQKLYDLARAGKTIERRPSEIEIYKIQLLEYAWPMLKIEVQCSSGTYIRSLAHDIGEALGVGAYCAELARTAIGEHFLDDAQDIEKFYPQQSY